MCQEEKSQTFSSSNCLHNHSYCECADAWYLSQILFCPSSVLKGTPQSGARVVYSWLEDTFILVLLAVHLSQSYQTFHSNWKFAFLSLWACLCIKAVALSCSRCVRATADHQMSTASVYAIQEKASGKHSVSRGFKPRVCKKHQQLQMFFLEDFSFILTPCFKES